MAATFGVAVGIPVGDEGVSHSPFMEGVTTGTQAELIVGIGFLLCYLLSYYRLPLYPISAYSTIQAYFVSRSKLQSALFCLRHSSLHWDECVFLPLPYLKNLLLLASEQDMEGTLSEINFIVQERSQQRRAAQAVAYELALRDFEQRTILRDIGLAHQQLALFVPPQLRALSTSAEKVFRHLDDASREAASYHTQINKQDRQAALERMLNALHKIHPHTAFGNVKLNCYLRTVVDLFQNPCSKLYMPAIRLKRNLKRLRRLRYLSAMILKRFKAPMTCSLTTRWLEILWLLRLSSWVSG